MSNSTISLLALAGVLLAFFVFPGWAAAYAGKRGHRGWKNATLLATCLGLGLVVAPFALWATKTHSKLPQRVLVILFGLAGLAMILFGRDNQPVLGMGVLISILVLVLGILPPLFARLVSNPKGVKVFAGILGVLMIAGLVVPIGAYFYSSLAEKAFQASYARSFEPGMEAFLNIPSLEEAQPGTAINGKIVIVDPQARSVDSLVFDPRLAGLIAAHPDEVGTIIWKQCTERQVVAYANGGGHGYQESCTLTVIERAKSQTLATAIFTAPPPPASYGPCYLVNGSGCGDLHSRPNDEIVTYILGLPRP